MLFLSVTLSRNSMDFVVEFAVKIAKQLDYQSSNIDKMQLAFLCHVRNLLVDDRKKSEVLPSVLLKYVRELRVIDE